MESDYLKNAVRRLRIAAGQISGLEKMLLDGKYCIDIINQSAAVKEALSGFENLVLEHHLKTHVADQMRKGEDDKATKEMLSVYRISRRR
ncbi:MAG TPA: metal-sensitive transcriptional regulator [Candidatus Paceibacterota bacterium]|nr:metal-sensitive transcriptional regulator [Candidatus Paceibacterota bacterium]